MGKRASSPGGALAGGPPCALMGIPMGFSPCRVTHPSETLRSMKLRSSRTFPGQARAASVARIKSIPTDDDAFGKGMIRADGRKIHPSYLWEVKKPSESKGPWDLFKVAATVPADQAFRPLAEGRCSLA